MILKVDLYTGKYGIDFYNKMPSTKVKENQIPNK